MVHCIPNNSLFLSLKFTFILANSEDPDEMPHYAAFHLGLHCFPKYPSTSYQPKRVTKVVNLMCAFSHVATVGLRLGLARLIEISVNRSIYKRKTIIDMKIQKSVTFYVCSVYLFN